MKTILNDREYYDETFEKIHLKAGDGLRARFTDCTFDSKNVFLRELIYATAVFPAVLFWSVI